MSFNVTNKSTGKEVEVVDVKYDVIGSKISPRFLVYNVSLAQWDLRDANNYSSANGEEQVITTISVENEQDFADAIAGTYSVINITDGFHISNPLVVSRPVTINGNGNILNFTSEEAKDGMQITADSSVTISNLEIDMTNQSTGWHSDYCIQVFKTQGCILKDIVCHGADSGILVNGATVRIEGTIDVSNCEFGGIEASSGSGVTTDSVLYVYASVINSTESYGMATIRIDGTGTVYNATNYTVIDYDNNGDIQTHYYLREENSIEPVTSISIPNSALTLNIDEFNVISPTATPSTANYGAFTFASSNISVATVSTDGMIHPQGSGTTTITVSCTNFPNVKTQMELTVTAYVTGIEVTPNPVVVKVGETINVSVIRTPENADSKLVTWGLGSPAYVRVQGKVSDEVFPVTGLDVGTGTANIRASDAGAFSVQVPYEVVEDNG